MSNSYKVIAPVIVLVLLFNTAFAQFQGDVYRQYNNTKVTAGGKPMELPWTGGVNNPRIGMADLNKDGLGDIVVLEEGINVSTYIATGKGTYRYDSYYERNFIGVVGYVMFVDFNRDNIPDLVHHGGIGVTVSYGYYSGNELKFNYYKGLHYELASNNWNQVYVSYLAIPAIADVDGDTDLDIISYNIAGELITYFQNCQIEDNLPIDSIKICVKETCWGRTRQNFERKHILGLSKCVGGWLNPTTCKGCPPSVYKATDGINTLCFIDMDSDGDLDFFNGHQGFTDVQFFKNGKSQYGVDSIIHEDTIWESNGVKMNMPNFPGVFVLDIDHDGDDDLIFTPLDESTENYKSISFYENVGNNANKNYVYKSNTHLVDRMIDLGISSYPVFYDFDKDGKKDLFVGSQGYRDSVTYKNLSKVSYYKNTSTPGNYSFELQTDDFLGLDALDIEGAALAMGDLDNDTLDDLVIGHTDGTFSFYKNYAASNTVAPDWRLEIAKITDQTTSKIMSVGGYATPCIYDIDNDGKNDLISGSEYGGLYYYNNYGTNPGALNLKYETDTLGGVRPHHINYSDPRTTPFIGHIDDSEIDYLVVGCNWGILYRYDGFQNGAMPAQYKLIDTFYSYLDIGKRSAPAFANIDNDTTHLYEMVVGNILGGLKFYKQDFKVSVNDRVVGSKDVLVYPNPAGNILNVKWGKGFDGELVTVQIYSVTGQLMMHQSYDANTLSCSLSLTNVPSGTYYCVVQSASGKTVQPVSVLK